MQIGKVPPALPALKLDLHLSIVATGWVLSSFSIIGAIFGCFAGALADRIGARTVTVVGLLSMAAASVAGAFSDSAALLLISRAVEGMAFVVIVVAIPSLLVASAAPEHRGFVPSLWGTYMPVGMALGLVLAPVVLVSSSWRTLWEWNAALLVAAAALVGILKPPRLPPAAAVLTFSAIRRTLASRGAQVLAVMFAAYALQYLCVVGFLPTILQQQGVSPRVAGGLTAIAALANAGGNLVASALVARRVPVWRLMMFAAVVMGIASLGIFSASLSPLARYLLVVLFTVTGGLVPASIFASVPAVVRETKTGAVTMGLLVQASHIGQLIGPPVVAAVAVYAGGWNMSPVVLVPAAGVVIFMSLLMRSAPAPLR